MALGAAMRLTDVRCQTSHVSDGRPPSFWPVALSDVVDTDYWFTRIICFIVDLNGNHFVWMRGDLVQTAGLNDLLLLVSLECSFHIGATLYG